MTHRLCVQCSPLFLLFQLHLRKKSQTVYRALRTRQYSYHTVHKDCSIFLPVLVLPRRPRPRQRVRPLELLQLPLALVMLLLVLVLHSQEVLGAAVHAHEGHGAAVLDAGHRG